jgi:hypothetical protein
MQTNITQSEQFKILWGFFAKHGAEVEAHGSDELLPEQRSALAQLASGDADSPTRLKLIPLLQGNRNALAYLGEQIKIARPSASRKTRSARNRAPRRSQ